MAKTIQGLESYEYGEVVDIVHDFIIETLNDCGYDENDIVIKDIKLHGSRLRGQAKPNSDLDAVVEYDGDIREDHLFNVLNEDPLFIEDIQVDINPIQEDMSGYMKRSDDYDRKKLHLESLEKRVKALEDFFNEETDDQIRKVGNKWKILKSNGRSFWDSDYDTKEDAEKALRSYRSYARDILSEKESEGVIRKVGNKWRILKKNRKDYWDAEYDTKSDAEAALRAYWANKR